MISKQISEFNKVYTGVLKDVSLASKKGSDELTLLTVTVAVPEVVKVRGEEKTVNINYTSRVKSVNSESQHAFTIDPLLAQVYEFDEENELKTLTDKIIRLKEHIDLDSISFEMVPNEYTSYDAEGNQIKIQGYDIIFDPANFQ